MKFLSALVVVSCVMLISCKASLATKSTENTHRDLTHSSTKAGVVVGTGSVSDLLTSLNKKDLSILIEEYDTTSNLVRRVTISDKGVIDVNRSYTDTTQTTLINHSTDSATEVSQRNSTTQTDTNVSAGDFNIVPFLCVAAVLIILLIVLKSRTKI